MLYLPFAAAFGCIICFSARARLLFSFSLRCALMCALKADLFSAKFCPQIVHLAHSAALGELGGIGDGAGLVNSEEDEEDVEDDSDRGEEAASFFLLAAVAPSAMAPVICNWSAPAAAAAALATPEIWSWP